MAVGRSVSRSPCPPCDWAEWPPVPRRGHSSSVGSADAELPSTSRAEALAQRSDHLTLILVHPRLHLHITTTELRSSSSCHLYPLPFSTHPLPLSLSLSPRSAMMRLSLLAAAALLCLLSTPALPPPRPRRCAHLPPVQRRGVWPHPPGDRHRHRRLRVQSRLSAGAATPSASTTPAAATSTPYAPSTGLAAPRWPTPRPRQHLRQHAQRRTSTRQHRRASAATSSYWRRWGRVSSMCRWGTTTHSSSSGRSSTNLGVDYVDLLLIHWPTQVIPQSSDPACRLGAHVVR